MSFSLLNSTVLLTGGAGSLGSVLLHECLKAGVKTVRVLDSDEYGLAKLKRQISEPGRTRLLLGDIRDYRRVRLAMADVDLVFHCAALKNLELSEYNPIEVCRTNIEGTTALVEAALETAPSRFIFVSSDKAIQYSTLYGSTKYIGEKIVLWADKIQEHTRFSVARPGNFLTSRGNVFEVWDEQQAQGKPLSITDPDMKRWFISTEAAALFLVQIAIRMNGGEIFVPKATEKRILDLVPKGAETVIIGRRPGEKLSEQLWTKDEEPYLTDQEIYYEIRPDFMRSTD